MKKIPTLFERDWEGDRSRVLPKYAVELPAGAVATVKWDGTACLVRDGKLYKRYDLKPGRVPPVGFEACAERDERTGHQPGWVPVGEGPEDKHFRLAPMPTEDGTYELCGPKVQANPQGLAGHALLLHGKDVLSPVPTDFEGLRHYLKVHPFEGIVWWVNGEPFCKVKRTDFGYAWPLK